MEISGVMLEMESSLAGAGGIEIVDWTSRMAERAEGTSERLGAEALAVRGPATYWKGVKRRGEIRKDGKRGGERVKRENRQM